MVKILNRIKELKSKEWTPELAKEVLKLEDQVEAMR
jgi:hypothetical protein